MCSSLNLNRENSDFIDFLSSDIGSQIFKENMLSIHIETGKKNFKIITMQVNQYTNF